MTTWTRHTAAITTAIVEVTFTTLTGRRRAANVALRIDAREGTYRVDMKSLACAPWEAIDGGEGFATLRQAKRFTTAWRRAVRAQSTLQPRDVSRP